ncbi:hypothetical protein RFZ01_08660, partial [Acinetobacter pittii]
FTAVIASVWLSEQWTIYHTLGGIVILIGIIDNLQHQKR